VIEERPEAEVTTFAPAGTRAWNPAFDITPAVLITAFITELGVLRPDSLGALRPAAARLSEADRTRLAELLARLAAELSTSG
jgi:methylthioribose-1-phosphate isomerase